MAFQNGLTALIEREERLKEDEEKLVASFNYYIKKTRQAIQEMLVI